MGLSNLAPLTRTDWQARPEFTGSFQPEMLAVWLIRTFSIDLVEHMARVAAPKTAVQLDPALSRGLGVSNTNRPCHGTLS